MDRYLLFPIRGGSPAVLIAGSLLLAFAQAAGLFGLWLALVVAMLLAAYAFRLLDAAAEGRARPPEMSMKLLSPAHERRPLWLLCAGVVGYGVYELLAGAVPIRVAQAVAGVLFLLAPAAVALLGLRLAHPVNVLNPVALLGIAARMGWHYPLVVVVSVAALVVIREAGAASVTGIIGNLLGLSALYVVFAVTGGSLYERRRALGTETVDSPEQRAERQRHEERQARDHFIDEVYRLERAGKRQQAFDLLGDHIAGHEDGLAEYEAVFAALGEWEDPALALAVGQGLVGALIDARRSGDAMAVAARCLSWSPDFRPVRAADALRLINEARERGQSDVAAALLEDFELQYPGDPAVAVAAQLRRE